VIFDARGFLIEPDSSGFRIVVNDKGALYPLTTDPIAQETSFKASNPDVNDRFGRALAFEGDTVVIGAPDEDSNASGVNGDQTGSVSRRPETLVRFPEASYFRV